MPKSAPKKNEPLTLRVNLLHPQGEPLRLGGKFFKWLVGYGRFIVIFVEIIVIVCFLYRFKLDADLERLNQDIKAEMQNLDAKKNDEILVKQTQQKLQLIKDAYKNSPDWKDFIQAITSQVPAGVIFHNLSVEHSQTSSSLQFKISAETKSATDITTFVNALKGAKQEEKDRKFKDVALSNIAFDGGIITFGITGSTK